MLKELLFAGFDVANECHFSHLLLPLSAFAEFDVANARHLPPPCRILILPDLM